MRDKNGRFEKGNSGFWLGKKRPELLSTNAKNTMFKGGIRNNIGGEFKKGLTPWNKNRKPIKCEVCLNKFEVNLFRFNKARFCSRKCKSIWLAKLLSVDPVKRYKNRLFLNARRRAIKRGARGTHSKDEWENLKELFDYKCAYCGLKEPEISLSEDHIIPLSRGGSDYIENIQPLCRRCNSKKYNKIFKFEGGVYL